MLLRYEHEVFSHADIELCWKVFTDWTRWNEFVPGTYGKIEWVEGAPWTGGSRVRMELLKPFPLVAHQLILRCTPLKEVSWLIHIGGELMEKGDTLEQWVTFKPAYGGGTNIATWMELAGEVTTVAGQDAVALMKDYKANFYNAYARYCDQLAGQSAAKTASASSMKK